MFVSGAVPRVQSSKSPQVEIEFNHVEMNTAQKQEQNAASITTDRNQQGLSITSLRANKTDWFPLVAKPILRQVNRLEVQAALSMSINIIPFWICTFPVTCNAIALYWCIQLEADCSFIIAVNPYLRNMFLFHAIYNPITYMLSSTEFRRALVRFLRRKFCIIRCSHSLRSIY